MHSQDVAPRPRPASAAVPGSEVGVEQAEAALVEHYPRLVRLAYLVLPPSLGRNRRVLTAHALTQRALPRGRASGDTAVLPAQKGAAAGRDGDPGYVYVRLRVLRAALEAGRPLTFRSWPTRAQLPPLLPRVWGLRLFPHSGGADELALDQRLAALSAPARAAFALRGLEGLADADLREVLAAAGAADPAAALAAADAAGGAGDTGALLASPEFDPCSLQARPTDLMRRRQHLKAALAAVAALTVCGALLGMPGDGWGPEGAAAPPYARNPAAQAALRPGKLTRVPAAAWESSARTDFSVWPARGELTGDEDLLRRALAVWARPGGSVQVSATPGTQAGAPPGPPHLLYAGLVDRSRVVLLYDGLRLARYAEAEDGTRGAALDFARVDGATAADADAVVLGRSDGNVRYLTAPWVRTVAVRDLLKAPGAAGATALARSADGVTEPFASPALQTGACRSWNVLELTDRTGTRLSTDLGELTPARLTAGRPGAPRDASAADWSALACSLADVRGQGVRSVNSWSYARQSLPDASGTAHWLCTRAETWRGGGPRVLAQFHAPGQRHGAVVAKAENASACGVKDPHVLAGVLWKSAGGGWYLLAAGDGDTASIRATGGVSGSGEGNLLAVRTEQGAQAGLEGTLEGGREITGLR